MQSLKFIGTLLVALGANSLHAQDLTADTLTQDTEQQLTLQWLEQQHIGKRFYDGYFQQAGLKRYERAANYTDLSMGYHNSTQDLYLQQTGAGSQGYQIGTKSYQRVSNSGFQLWGEAFYENTKIKDQRFNEQIDYDKIYPYVLSDSVGGDLNQERYYIQGGMAKQVGDWDYGLSASYLANQAYRKVDPRPINTSSDLKIQLASSYQLNTKYRLGIALDGGKYIQQSSVNFVSQLFQSPLYHDAGFGANNLLLMSYSSTQHMSYSYGGSMTLIPANQQGLYASLKYLKTDLDKSVSGIYAPVSSFQQQQVKVAVGYNKSFSEGASLKLDATAAAQKKTGEESIFYIDPSRNSLQLLSNNETFSDRQEHYTFNALWSQDRAHYSWNILLKTAYDKQYTYYLLPERQQQYDRFQSAIYGQLLKPLSKGLISARVGYGLMKHSNAQASWDMSSAPEQVQAMLLSNYKYLTTDRQFYSSELRYDVKLSKGLQVFVIAQGSQTTRIKQQEYSLRFGFLF